MTNKYFIDTKNWELEFLQRNEHTVLMADLWCKALCINFEREINIPGAKYTEYLFTSPRNGYVNISQKKNILSLLEKIINDKNYLQFVYDKTLNRVAEFNSFANKINKRMQMDRLSRGVIRKMWEDYDNVMLNLIPWFYIPYYITEGNMLTNKVGERMRKYGKEIEKYTDFNNAIALLVFPVKKMFFQKEQENFYKLVKLAEKKKDYSEDKRFLNLAKKYLDRYSWMKTFMVLPIESLTLTELMKRIETALNDNYLEDYEIQKKQKIKSRKIAKLIFDKIKNDKKLVGDIEWSQKFGWLLTVSVEKTLIAGCKLSPFYKILAKRMRVPYKDWVHLTSDEIIKILDGKKPLIKEIEERKKSFVFLMRGDDSIIYTGKDSKEIINKLTLDSVSSLKVKELKGRTAMGGNAIGKAHIILEGKDSYKLKRGEILVCSMTSPDYIPAMKKSAGIITDEGGLLCHAAIISRELGKPCIIGTKIATKVLKDGDLVKVDGNNGVVRILRGDFSKQITTLTPKQENQEKSTDYVRMFGSTGMPFLINSIALEHYKELKAMAIFKDNLWTAFLPKPIQKTTLKEGVRLFGDKDNFNKYTQDFNEYKKRSTKFFEEIIYKEKISEEELNKFFDLISELWLYYRKTEFFYVDDAYRKSQKDKTTAENLKHLEEIKNSGREHLNKMIFGSSSYLTKVIAIISKQFNVDIDSLFWSSKMEILTLYDNVQVAISKIKERKDAYVFLIRNGDLITFDGAKAKNFISSFVVKESKGVIRGIIANPGKAKGRVKILFYGADTFDKVAKMMKEIREGDILVAETTSPEIMSACKKASAILTNQGGLLSHAAIVSRELKIPCIVGLRDITHVVKDDDEVEVDANKGVVKIIKKK